jgi:hypothetical protein
MRRFIDCEGHLGAITGFDLVQQRVSAQRFRSIGSYSRVTLCFDAREFLLLEQLFEGNTYPLHIQSHG